jgi:hypothetical protein
VISLYHVEGSRRSRRLLTFFRAPLNHFQPTRALQSPRRCYSRADVFICAARHRSP